MIKANELRVGNILSYGFQKEIVLRIVKTIGETGINGEMLYEHPDEGTEPSFSEDEYEVLQPIPLTPEILVKAGFKKSSITSSKNVYYEINVGASNYLFQLLPDGTVFYGNWFESGFTRESRPLSSLHDLQNLYFALVGEELELSL